MLSNFIAILFDTWYGLNIIYYNCVYNERKCMKDRKYGPLYVHGPHPPPSSYIKYIKKGNLECYLYIYIEYFT